MSKKLYAVVLISLIVLACSPCGVLSNLQSKIPPISTIPAEISTPRSVTQPPAVTVTRPAARPTFAPSNATKAQVVRVIDGDTIEVKVGGQTEKVRYIGIDAPEMNHPEHGIEPYGPEATARNKALVAGKAVRLEKDVSETDRYGRLLRYVWIGDRMVNEMLVREGLAHSSTYPPDVKHQRRLQQAERQARSEKRGLWSTIDAPDDLDLIPPGQP